MGGGMIALQFSIAVMIGTLAVLAGRWPRSPRKCGGSGDDDHRAGMNPTRRGLFAAFASLTPAGAADPIFAAIERHRAAWNAAEAAMNDVSRHQVERTAAEAVAATVPASRAGVVALVGYLRDLERSLPRNDDLYGAMPDGFEAAVRENIRLALTALA
jgi:hypothetical protein